MAKITAKQVKELRDKTGAGMMDAKNALVEVGGDMEQAIDYLRTKGLATVAKKANRIAAEGLASAKIAGNKAAVVEVNSETDFVAKNKQFQDLVEDIVTVIAEEQPADMEAAKELKIGDETITDAINEAITVIGEKLDFRRFNTMTKEDDEVFGDYIHAGGSIVALVKLEGADEETARDVAMHVAAINPKYLDQDAVPAEDIAREREVQTEKTLAEGKPEHIVDKIVEGRMGRFFSEVTLLGQDFVKDGDMTVEEYVKSKGGKVLDFVRYEVGEGLAKREENFADEVASQMKQD